MQFRCCCQAGEKDAPRQTKPPCARVDRFDIDMCKYDSHEEMVGRLRALEAEHPGLAKTGIIGKTVEGSDLIYVKVWKPRVGFELCRGSSALFQRLTFLTDQPQRLPRRKRELPLPLPR